MNVREKSKSFARLMRSVLVAFVTGLVFWQLDNTQAGAISRLGAIATIVGFVGYDGVEEITMIFASRFGWYV